MGSSKSMSRATYIQFRVSEIIDARKRSTKIKVLSQVLYSKKARKRKHVIYTIIFTTVSFGYERVPHCVGCLIDNYDVKIISTRWGREWSMIATNGGRARSKLRNRESLFARKRITNQCVSLGTFFFLLLLMMMMMIIIRQWKKGCFCATEGAPWHAWKENSKPSLFPTTYATIRFRLAYVGSVRWEFKTSVSITGINFSGRSVRPSIIFPGVATVGE